MWQYIYICLHRIPITNQLTNFDAASSSISQSVKEFPHFKQSACWLQPPPLGLTSSQFKRCEILGSHSGENKDGMWSRVIWFGVKEFSYPADGGNIFLWKVGTCLSNYKALYPRTASALHVQHPRWKITSCRVCAMLLIHRIRNYTTYLESASIRRGYIKLW
jgi:hypothetical protein